MASTNPSPKVLRAARNVRMFSGFRYVLLGLRTDSAIIDNRSTGNRVFPVVNKDCRVHEIAICIIVPNPEFCDLAGRPTIRVLMASDAGSGVVHRSKPILDRLVFLIDILIPSKRDPPGGSTIPLLMLAALLKLGVLNPAGASVADCCAMPTTPMVIAISAPK